MKKIEIRTATAADAEELSAIYAPYVAETAVSFEIDVPTAEDFAERITKTLEKYPYFAAESEGEIVGYAYASAFKARAAYDRAAELSIYVKRGFSGRGIGRGLYEALENALREQNILNTYACIAYAEREDQYLTRGSVMFHEKCGYKKVAHFHNCGFKFGRWYDMIWMEKYLGTHTDSPEKVVWFSEV